VSQVAGVPLFMFAAGRSPFNSVADAVTAAKTAPDTVSYATGGAGSSGHLAAELFARPCRKSHWCMCRSAAARRRSSR